jgi:putative Mg2+ transporter-C (MgtC) family protein
MRYLEDENIKLKVENDELAKKLGDDDNDGVINYLDEEDNTELGALVDINTQFGDPTRAMHAIMTGIGFLGAGLIFSRKKSGVSGVTTAATVFATAAMGCAIGLGFQLAAAAMTLVVVAILRSTHVLERTLHANDDDD